MEDEILILSLKKLSEAFNEFISCCLDEFENPKSPTRKELMKARGFLPPYCNLALSKGKQK
jgi:hypothetical protein